MSVDEPRKPGECAICEALCELDIAAIEKWLKRDPSLAHPTSWFGPLHVCAECNWVAGAELLHRFGADVNGRDHNGSTPLQVAVSHDCTEMASWLVEHGADVNADDPTGLTAVQIAANQATGGDERMLNFLVDHGAQIDLRSAIVLGRTESVRAMLKEDPGMVRNHPQGNDLITDAVCGLLGRLGYPPEQPEETSELDETLQTYREMLELLIAHGADVNARSRASTALHRAVSSSLNDPRVAELLLDLGADVNVEDSSKETPLDLARMACRSAVPILMEHGARRGSWLNP